MDFNFLYETKRYRGYVCARQEVYDVLEWMDNELLDGKWLVGKFDSKHHAYGCKHTWVFRQWYGARNVLGVMGRNKVYEELDLGMFGRMSEMRRNALVWSDWEWVRRKRKELGCEAIKVKASKIKGSAGLDLWN